MKNKQLKNSLITISLFLVVLIGLHLMLLDYVLPESYKQFDVIYIYVFLGLFSIFGVSAIFLIHKNDDALIGKGFLVYTVLKLLASVAFLLPRILHQDDFTRPFVYQFFGVFFPLLLVETMMILKIVQAIDGEKSKNEENQP